MKIISNALHTQFHTQETFQPGSDSNRTLLIPRARLPETGISLQQVLVGAGKITQAWAPDLLLSFNQEGHTTWQSSMHLAPGPHSPKARNQVALVIGHTTSIKTTIPDGCLERWHTPGLQRLRRLDIVVVVDGESTRAITSQASHHHRKTLGRHQRGLGPWFAQASRHKLRHFPHSLALRGDTRLAAEALQVSKRCISMRFDPGQDGFKTFSRSRNRHSTSPLHTQIANLSNSPWMRSAQK